jgi:hypothetical protein
MPISKLLSWRWNALKMRTLQRNGINGCGVLLFTRKPDIV